MPRNSPLMHSQPYSQKPTVSPPYLKQIHIHLAFSATLLGDLCGENLNFDSPGFKKIAAKTPFKATGSDSTARWCFALEVWAASSMAGR